MKILEMFKNIFPKKIKKRKFEASGTGRLLQSWTTKNSSYDYDIRDGVETLRARCRDLAENNEYATRYLKLCVTNIVGAKGIILQNKSMFENGRPDTVANKIIEREWREWSKRSSASVDKSLSWLDMQRVIVETAAMDGEIFILKHKNADNKYRFALQLVEADYCDIKFNDESRNIKMGIEYNSDQKPIAYWMYKKHPGDSQQYTNSFSERVRIEADKVIHVFYKERSSQTRGVPWMKAGMKNLKHLAGYKEAELIASRVAAAKMGFLITDSGDEYKGEGIDVDGNVTISAEPGTFEQLPKGWSLDQWDPQHPNSAFKEFIKTELQGLASALNVSYMSLSQDLEGASYSSGRLGSLDERDNWRVKQQWISDICHNNIFSDWLENVLLLGITKLPYSKYDKFNSPKWFPRGWDWVDPLKDSKANIEEINNNLKSRSQVVAEKGLDFVDVVEQLQYENEVLQEAGLSKNNSGNVI
jgi:lambda family phage portal protein